MDQNDPSVMKELKYGKHRNEIIRIIMENTVVLEEYEKETWGIYFNGKRVGLHNRKSVWAKKHHAMSALTDKIKDRFERDSGYRRDSGELYATIIQHLKDEGILEIRRLDKPEETNVGKEGPAA